MLRERAFETSHSPVGIEYTVRNASELAYRMPYAFASSQVLPAGAVSSRRPRGSARLICWRDATLKKSYISRTLSSMRPIEGVLLPATRMRTIWTACFRLMANSLLALLWFLTHVD